MEQEEKLCDEVETVREFTYLGDRVGAGGGCEAAVTENVMGILESQWSRKKCYVMKWKQ